MKHKKYLITSSINGVKSKQVWSSENKLSVRNPLNYTLEYSDSKIIIKNSLTTNTISEHNATEADILFNIDPQTSLNIHPIKPLKPVFFSEPLTTENKFNSGCFYIFEGFLKNITSSEPINSYYLGHQNGKLIFTITAINSNYRIKSFSNTLNISLVDKEVTLESNKTLEIKSSDLAQAKIKNKSKWWKINVLSTPMSIIDFDDKQKDQTENDWFGRSLAYTAALIIISAVTLNFLPDSFINSNNLKTTQIKIQKYKPIVPKRFFEPKAVIKPDEPKLVSKTVLAPTLAKESLPSKVKKTTKVSNTNKNLAAKAPTKPSIKDIKSKQILTRYSKMFQGALKNIVNKNQIKKNIIKKPVKLVKPNIANKNIIVRKQFEQINIPNLKNKIDTNTVFDISQRKLASYNKNENISLKGQGKSFFEIANVDEVLVDEGLNKNEITKTIKSHMGEIQYCYESAALYNPDLEGKLITEFTITRSGKVESVKAEESTLNSPKLEKCILGRLKVWKFTRPQKGVSVKVSYPFVFRLLGS